MPDSFVIAADGTAGADITISPVVSEAERHAAEELASFLGQVTGGEFAVAYQPGEVKHHIFVGRETTRARGMHLDARGLSRDGILIRREGNDLFLSGGGPRGVLYSVYTFLEKYAGCRWWSAAASTIPRRPTLVVGAIDEAYNPQLEYRHTSWFGSFDPEWASRNRLNGSPYLNRRILGRNIRFFAEHNAQGIYEQGGSLSPWPEFGELRAWMIARLLWDPTQDGESLLREFCGGYYGEAGRRIARYIDLVHNGIEGTPDVVMRNSSPDYRFITFGLVTSLWKGLQLALDAVADDEELLERVERTSMSLRYTCIFNWRRLADQCRASEGTWFLAPRIEEEVEVFVTWAKSNEITHIFEWHPGFGRMEKMVAEANGESNAND